MKTWMWIAAGLGALLLFLPRARAAETAAQQVNAFLAQLAQTDPDYATMRATDDPAVWGGVILSSTATGVTVKYASASEAIDRLKQNRG